MTGESARIEIGRVSVAGAPAAMRDGAAFGAPDDGPAHRQSDAAARSAVDDGAAHGQSYAAPGCAAYNAAARGGADDATPHDQADGERNNQTDAAAPADRQADAEDARPDPTPDGPF